MQQRDPNIRVLIKLPQRLGRQNDIGILKLRRGFTLKITSFKFITIIETLAQKETYD